jgi:hypothetical protein
MCTVKLFDKEEDAKEFVKANALTSEIGHLEDGRYYVGLNNILPDIIRKGIDRAVKYNEFSLELGMAWNVGSNWGQCH